MGIGVDNLPKSNTSGVGGSCEIGETEINISFGQRGEYYDFEILIQIPIKPEFKIFPILGREPLFREFDVGFRLGYCENKGKFTLKKVEKTHDSKKYSAPPVL